MNRRKLFCLSAALPLSIFAPKASAAITPAKAFAKHSPSTAYVRPDGKDGIGHPCGTVYGINGEKVGKSK